MRVYFIFVFASSTFALLVCMCVFRRALHACVCLCILFLLLSMCSYMRVLLVCTCVNFNFVVFCIFLCYSAACESLYAGAPMCAFSFCFLFFVFSTLHCVHRKLCMCVSLLPIFLSLLCANAPACAFWF